MKWFQAFPLPLDGMLVHVRIPPPPPPKRKHKIRRYPFKHLDEEGHHGIKGYCLVQEHNLLPRPGHEPGPLEPESSALTIRPLRPPPLPFLNFHLRSKKVWRILTLRTYLLLSILSVILEVLISPYPDFGMVPMANIHVA